MTDTEQSQAVADHLRAQGHTTAADHLAAAHAHTGTGLWEALREACQSILTAVEALDPASYAAVEKLRMDVDQKLDTGRTSA